MKYGILPMMVFALLANALSADSAAAAPTSTTIMAVGDSITYGCGYQAKPPNFALQCSAGDSSYRGKLYELLTASGHAVQMVGRVASGDPSDAGFPAAQHGHEAGFEVLYEKHDFRRYQSSQSTIFSGTYIVTVLQSRPFCKAVI